MKRIGFCVAWLACCVTIRAVAADYDVVIYGGTSAGVTAAVQAARMGKRAVIVNPERHLGGMSASGLGMTDNGSTESIGGVAREFYRRVYRHYQKPEAWKFIPREEYVRGLPLRWGVDGPRMEQIQAQFVFEPHAAESVFDDMVKESGVTVVSGERLDLKSGVKKDGLRIASIACESGKIFAGKMFIDATYEGDLMAKAGVSYFVGRESNSDYNETLNGIFPFTPAPFPKVDPWVILGDKSSGLLPRVDPRPPGKKGEGDKRNQAFNFRLCLTKVSENRVPFVKPAGYDPRDYELLARWIATMKNVRPGRDKSGGVSLRGDGFHLGVSLDEVPNRKTDSNNGSEFGSDMFGASYTWAEGDYAERKRVWELHKNYTQGLLWFLANDPRVPEPVRAEFSQWGLAKDEFTDNDHWPFQIYVREARRMISDYVITEHDARGAKIAEDSVAIASYALDSHGVSLFIDENGLLHRERGFYTGSKPFPVSYRAIRPKADQCSNLLVPGCVSATHAAYGVIRMEPVFMMLGQSAATAACLAIDAGISVQQVNYESLSKRLIADKQILVWSRPRPSKPAAPETPQAADAQLEADLKILVERKIVDSPDYWLQNARNGKQCDGGRVGELLLKMARSLDESVRDHAAAVALLAEKRVFRSTAFWLDHAKPGGNCSGAYVRSIIRNFVGRVRKG